MNFLAGIAPSRRSSFPPVCRPRRTVCAATASCSYPRCVSGRRTLVLSVVSQWSRARCPVGQTSMWTDHAHGDPPSLCSFVRSPWSLECWVRCHWFSPPQSWPSPWTPYKGFEGTMFLPSPFTPLSHLCETVYHRSLPWPLGNPEDPPENLEIHLGNPQWSHLPMFS